MPFPLERFTVRNAKLSADELARCIADRLKADIYGQRVFGGISYQHPKNQDAPLAWRKVAQLHVLQDGDHVVICVGLRGNLMESRFEAVQAHAQQNPELFKRLESMAHSIKTLKPGDWPGFSRAAHGQSLRQLWCYALDAIEGNTAQMHAVFQRNTQAFVSDLATEASVREMLLIQEHESQFGCMPSQIQRQFEADVEALRDLAVGVALALGQCVHQEADNGDLRPIEQADYLTSIFFKAPRHFQVTGRHPYDFFDIGLRNLLSFNVVDAVELHEAHACSNGYRATTEAGFKALKHPTKSTIYVVALPRSMVRLLEQQQSKFLALRAKQATESVKPCLSASPADDVLPTQVMVA